MQSNVKFHIPSSQEAALDFEALISDISSGLVLLRGNGIDTAIESSLQKILDSLPIDRAALFQAEEPDCKRFILTHVKIRPGCGPQERPALTADSFP